MQLRPFIGVRGVTAPQVIKIKESNLATRIISAFVMMPLVIFITYLGYPYFNLLVGFCSVLMAWEYNRIISGSRQDYAGFVLIIGLVSAVIMVSTATVMSAFFSLGALCLIFLCIDLAKIFVFKVKIKSSQMGRTIFPIRSLWIVAGVVYMGGSCISLIWLRNTLDNGLLVVMWILFLVWASDCGAYALGRLIGGPKLAPRISPNKTWAGLAGCVISASIVGAMVAHIALLDNFFRLVVLSGLIGLISQMGDLLESAIKRFYSVKDSGNLIPGHGGILDRVDALLAAIIAVALLSAITEGTVLL